MAIPIDFYKVRTLPVNPKPNSFYYLLDEDEDVTLGYLTDDDGNLVPIEMDPEHLPPGPPGPGGPIGPPGPAGSTEDFDPGDLTLVFANKLI